MFKDDCYSLLGISPDADEKTIRKAYRERSKELHPDVNPSPDAAQSFAKLSYAHSTLLDPVARLKHDDHFGYNKNIRNQDSNAKQQFSDFQKQKATSTVNEWSADYGKAMKMRDQQRLKHIETHRRRMKWIMIIAIATIAISITCAVLVFVSTG